MGFLRKTKSSTPTKEVAHLAIKTNGDIGISTPSKSSTATIEGRDDKPEGVVSPTAISSAGRSRAYSSSPVVSSRNAGRASPVVTTGGMKEAVRDLPTSKATNRSHSVPTVPSNTKEGIVAKKKTSEHRKSRGSTPSSLPSTTSRRSHKERIQKQMSHSTAGQKTVKASGNGKQSKIDHSAKTKQTKNKKKMDIMSDDDDSYASGSSSDDSHSLSEYSSGSELDDDEYTYDDSQYSYDVHSYSLASDDDSESGDETDDDMPRRKHRSRSRKLKKGKTAAKSKGRKSSGRGKGKDKVTNSVADFLMNMENYDILESENQVVIRVEEHGNVEKLMLQEHGVVPQPTKSSDIVVKVDCSTITLQDCMIRRGNWNEMQSLPFVPGSDFVGTIHAMGDEATKNSTFQVGDKVCAAVSSGGNAKYITLPYHSLIRVPDGTDSVVALCLSSTYVPAREALDLARKRNTPFTGANILVIGGNGPNGLATIELALLEGANVFTTADERHHEYLTKKGAKCFPIDPKKWLPTLQGKMDVVLDSVCLDGYESSSLALNSVGKMVCTGMSAVFTQGQIRAYFMRDVRQYKAMYCRMRAKYFLSNSVVYDRMDRFKNASNEYAQHFRYLCHLASKDTIAPLVSARATLNLVASVEKTIEHGNTKYGVCVCTPWGDIEKSSNKKTDKKIEEEKSSSD